MKTLKNQKPTNNEISELISMMHEFELIMLKYSHVDKFISKKLKKEVDEYSTYLVDELKL